MSLSPRQCDYVRCGATFVPREQKARFCCDAHRVAQWRLDHGILPKSAVRTPPRRRSGGPSGRSIRISYFQAHAAFVRREVELGMSPEEAEADVTAVLAPTLTERARRLLEKGPR